MVAQHRTHQTHFRCRSSASSASLTAVCSCARGDFLCKSGDADSGTLRVLHAANDTLGERTRLEIDHVEGHFHPESMPGMVG